MINLTKMLELTIAGKEDGKKLLQLEDMLKQYIIEQTVKSKGGNKELQRLTAGRKYLKESKKINIGRPSLWGSWIENGKQYMTNTYSGIELVSIIEGLEQLPEDILAPKIFDIIESTDKNANIKVDIPGVTELKIQFKTAIAVAKAKGIETTNTKEGLIKIGESIIDLKLFLDTIAIFPSGELEYYVGEGRLSPVIIKDNLGNKAIVLAIRMKSEEDYKNAV